jgi:Protein of unknown function (DUF998)
MSNKETDASTSKISITAARLAIGAVLAYQTLLILLIFIRPDLDPSWHTISEWAIGPHGWIMTTAFFISAFSYASLFGMLKSQLRGTMGRIGQIILLVCVAGTFGVGAFTTDPLTTKELSTTGILHMITGASALMLFPFAALFINLSLAANNEAWISAKRVLLWTSGLPLFGLGAFMTYHAIYVAPLGPYAYGPGVHIGWPPRFALFTYMLWLVMLALQAIKIQNNRNRNPPEFLH